MMKQSRTTLTLLCLLCALCIVSAPGVLRAEDAPPVTVTLQYTPANLLPYTSTVPQIAGNSADIPIRVSEGVRWIVSFDFSGRSDKQFHVSVVDPTLVIPNSVDMFYADFKWVEGKPITLLKTTSGTLEVTLTHE